MAGFDQSGEEDLPWKLAAVILKAISDANRPFPTVKSQLNAINSVAEWEPLHGWLRRLSSILKFTLHHAACNILFDGTAEVTVPIVRLCAFMTELANILEPHREPDMINYTLGWQEKLVVVTFKMLLAYGYVSRMVLPSLVAYIQAGGANSDARDIAIVLWALFHQEVRIGRGQLATWLAVSEWVSLSRSFILAGVVLN